MSNKPTWEAVDDESMIHSKKACDQFPDEDVSRFMGTVEQWIEKNNNN